MEKYYITEKNGEFYLMGSIDKMECSGGFTTREEAENEKLRYQVVDQIESDINEGDTTALHELLSKLPTDVLSAYLPEQPFF